MNEMKNERVISDIAWTVRGRTGGCGHLHRSKAAAERCKKRTFLSGYWRRYRVRTMEKIVGLGWRVAR